MNKSVSSTLLSMLMLMTMIAAAAPKQKPITFNISFIEPQAHYVEMEMVIPDVKESSVDVKMPVWAPGSYLVREFSRNVESLRATDATGNKLHTIKKNKNTWHIDTKGKSEIHVRYRIYAFEVSVRTSFVDASHAFLSSTGTFLYVDGQIDRQAVVNVKPFQGWTRVSTGLQPIEGKEHSFSAANFDILFDSPLEIGNQDIFTFDAAGVHHEVAMYGGGNYDKQRLATDMAKIVEEATRVFGENPNKHYVFIVHNYQSGGGGLEHLNSTVLGASRNAYGTEVGYRGFLGLVAHEYFHLWNIKRLRPEALGPFNYDEENYTTNLWIGEGFTAYYDNLLVYRAGANTQSGYLQALAGDISAVENRAGNQVQSLSESSFDAWIKYYRQDENSINSLVSYYNKGALMAALTDLKILEATEGRKGLDDVMREAYSTFFKKRDKGYTDSEFKALAERVGGVKLDDIWVLVNEPGTPDYNRYLAYAGLGLMNLNEGSELPDLGLRTSGADGKVMVQSVIRGGSGWDAGINVKDELIAMNGNRLDAAGKEMDRIVNSSEVGDKLDVLIARDGLLKSIPLMLKANKTGRYLISPLDDETAEQQVIRDAWLKQSE